METFKDVISGDQLVLVDFFATWCQPCKMKHPIFEPMNERTKSRTCSSYSEQGGGRRSQQVKAVLGDSIRIIKVDVKKYGVTANQYDIRSVPTLMLFRHGEVLWRTSGVMQ